MICSCTALKVPSRSECAPPNGSLMISSTIFSFIPSSAVNFNASAAFSFSDQLRHNIEEQFSGEITEYHEFSNIYTLSPTPIPKAPPEAPSPIIIVIIGVFKRVISKILRAIASPCPLSSASNPG